MPTLDNDRCSRRIESLYLKVPTVTASVFRIRPPSGAEMAH